MDRNAYAYHKVQAPTIPPLMMIAFCFVVVSINHGNNTFKNLKLVYVWTEVSKNNEIYNNRKNKYIIHRGTEETKFTIILFTTAII